MLLLIYFIVWKISNDSFTLCVFSEHCSVRIYKVDNHICSTLNEECCKKFKDEIKFLNEQFRISEFLELRRWININVKIITSQVEYKSITTKWFDQDLMYKNNIYCNITLVNQTEFNVWYWIKNEIALNLKF